MSPTGESGTGSLDAMSSAFGDPGVEPTTARIHTALGPAAETWDELAALFADAGAPLTWRYYRDGGWLAKASKGRTTIAWFRVAQGHATVTFYFAERHRSILTQHQALTDELRHRVATTALSGKLLPVTLELHDSSQLSEVRALLATKVGTGQGGPCAGSSRSGDAPSADGRTGGTY